MKLVTFEVNTAVGKIERIGAVIEKERIIDLNAGYALHLDQVEGETKPYALAEVRVPSEMVGFLEGEEKSMEAARKTIDYVKTILGKGISSGLNGEKLAYERAEIKLLAPVPRPNTLTDFLCFEEHMKDAGDKSDIHLSNVWYEIPACYKGNPCTVIGPDDDIYWPNYGEVDLDYECEIGMYIGKKGRDIPVEEASKYIAGFTIFNDVSERVTSTKDIFLLGPAKGKDFDHANVMGPYLVTPDELDTKSIKVTVKINGEFQVEGYAKDMYWSWEQLIAYASRTMTLYPGDFFGSGTVGLCCGVSTGRTLKLGDVIEFEATGIGNLRNKVVKG